MWTASLLISCLLLASPSSSSRQIPLSTPSTPSTPSSSSHSSENLISALSSSKQHTTLLRLLQRSKCIPILSHIPSATVFAPTDAAWDAWADSHSPPSSTERMFGWFGPEGLSEWFAEDDGSLDNENWALRQHLLYHMLNYTLEPGDVANSSGVVTHTTLLFPLDSEPDHTPLPDPNATWIPQGGIGMLGGHGQRLRLSTGEGRKVGVDWRGDGGVEVWDGSGWPKDDGNKTEVSKTRKKMKGAKWVQNGVVVGLNGVMDPPPSIEEIIRSHASLSYLNGLLTPPDVLPSPLPSSLSATPHLTVFAPSNEAFQTAFDDVEKRYLEGGYGYEAVGRILGGGVILGVGKDQVGWQDSWGKKGSEVASASGLGLCVETPANRSILVNSTEAQEIDIFASNGVVHIMPNLLIPDDFSLLNSAEKVLLSLNATRFVSLLRSANLSNAYVGESRQNGKDSAWTILAPTDEVLDMMDRWGGHGAPPLPEVWTSAEGPSAEEVSVAGDTTNESKDPSPLQQLLQYHILPGRISPSDIKDGMLVGTELSTQALGGGRQRLRVDVSDRIVKGRINWEDIAAGEIRFGGATVLGKPVKSGKSIIYLVSNLLAPPDDVLQTAVADLTMSTFIAAVYAAELDKAVKHNPAVTYFVPRNHAFSNLGLVMNYLLLPEGKDDLRKVVRYHAVDQIVYSSDIESGRAVYQTLEGGEVILEKSKGQNATVTLQSPTKWAGFDSGEALPANGALIPASVSEFDALTNTGVIHSIDSVVMPADVKMNIAKLIRGSKQSTMMDLMLRAGLGWVLDGREPSSSEVSMAALDGRVHAWDNDTASTPSLDSLAMPAYTVLCPTDKAFSRLNLTYYLSDRDALLDLLKLHIIPTQETRSRQPPKDGLPLAVDDDLVYSTLLSSSNKFGDVAFRATGDNSYIVGVRNARGGSSLDASARVGASGRASVRWRRRIGTKLADGAKSDVSDNEGMLWRGGMTLGGGVVMLDAVLTPYEPSWFSRWGWLVLTLSGVGVVLLGAGLGLGWWWMSKGKKGDYEPLEGEEDE